MDADLLSVHESAGSPTRIVFIVHGTFGRGSRWVRSGSQFCESLLRDLGANTLIRSFAWSGRNSVGARETASLRLREVLLESIRQFHGINHCVIGHSHGGNVALRAVDSPELQDVDVICLSTPILYAIERTFSTESRKFLWFFLSIPIFGTAFAGLFLQHHSRWPWIEYVWPPLAAFVTYMTWAALGEYQGRAKKTAKAIHVPSHDRVLFLRFVGDEASLALTTFQALQYAMNSLISAILAIFSVLQWINEWAKRKPFWLIVTVLAGPLGLFMANYELLHIDWWWLGIAALAPGLVLLMVGLLIPPLAVLALLIGLVSVMVGIAPLGLRLAVTSLWFELCVEPLPCGRWDAIVLAPSAQSSASGLRHSLSYQEEPAIHAIVEFLNGRPKTAHAGKRS